MSLAHAANMMLTKDLNTLKLADFGMSKKMYHEERTQVRNSNGIYSNGVVSGCPLFPVLLRCL